MKIHEAFVTDLLTEERVTKYFTGLKVMILQNKVTQVEIKSTENYYKKYIYFKKQCIRVLATTDRFRQ